jgi:hypothetical protein
MHNRSTEAPTPAMPRFSRVAVPIANVGLAARMGFRDHWLWVGGPLPRGAAGLTLGSLVIVRRESAARRGFERLLRHEQVHVAQFREVGVVRFVATYFGSYARWRLRGYNHQSAYRRIPFEVEARYLSSLPS